MDALQKCLPEADLQERLTWGDRFIGEQILRFLPKTFTIMQSAHEAFTRSHILEFARKGCTDDDLPFTVTKLKFIEEGFAYMFLAAQERFLAVSFEKKEHRFLTSTDSVPFIHKGHDALHVLRNGLFGEVTRVYEGSDVYARKKMEIGYRARQEYELLCYLPEHPHLLSLRASYMQEKNHYLVLSPWCEHTLNTFYTYRDSMKWWREVEDQVYVLVKWMHCLACALAVLHSYQVKHMDLKPENVGLYEETVTGGNVVIPVLLNYGCSKHFTVSSQAPCNSGNAYYSSPEKSTKRAEGRKGDVFSLGIIYLEILGIITPSFKKKWKKLVSKRLPNQVSEFEIVQALGGRTGEELEDLWIDLKALCISMVQKDADKRPSALEVSTILKNAMEQKNWVPHCNNVPLKPPSPPEGISSIKIGVETGRELKKNLFTHNEDDSDASY